MQKNREKGRCRARLAKSSEMRALGYPSGKAACPQCGKKRFVLYVNPDGSMVDPRCGRCDREVNCGYSMTPRDLGITPARTAPMPPPIPKKPFEIPEAIVKASLRHIGGSNLVKWLYSLPWHPSALARLPLMLSLYKVGTTRSRDTVWWQVDDNFSARSGKVMRYLPDGHRDKQHFGTWAHSLLLRQGKLDGKRCEYVGCLFGLHLLPLAQLSAKSHGPVKVHIVESEKSALVCAIFFGCGANDVFMATGGKGNLTRLRLLPLISAGVDIYVHPDRDAVEAWTEKAKEIGYDRLHVCTSFLDTYEAGVDGDNYDICDHLTKLLYRKKNEREQP